MPQDHSDPVRTRRAHPRVSVELAVSLASEHNFYAGVCANLSAGGIFVATHTLRQVGESVDFRIELPTGQTIKGAGEVRWLRAYDEASDMSPGMGIEFRLLEANSVAAIAKFIQQREPLFYHD